MPKLTRQFIESEIQPPATGQRFYRDEELPGFAIRVTCNSKSYILEKRVGGANRRITIGKCRELSLDAARKQAQIMLGEIAKGNDPKTGKRINTPKDTTLREAVHLYLEVKTLRPATQKNYRSSIFLHLRDWLDLPVRSITKDMCEQRFRDLTISPNRTRTSGQGRANCALKRLGTILSFAYDRCGTDDEPLLKTNPVSRLSRNRSWHRINPRQGIIPDNRIKLWYGAVGTLQHEVSRDFLLFLLFTGLRVGETRRLKWCHVDFENAMLVIPRELTKSDREHRLPLSDYLVDLLKKRYVFRKNSEWVFQAPRLKNSPLSLSNGFLCRVRAKCGINFKMHDLRRTFLTKAERLGVPTYVLKRLVNHSLSKDMTGQYIVLDIDSLRPHMACITNAFLDLIDMNDIGVRKVKPIEQPVYEQINQLQIPLNNVVPV
jgi:integrase